MSLRGTHQLVDLLKKHAVLRGDFLLSSGQRSDTYFDCRRVTHRPEARPVIRSLFADLFYDEYELRPMQSVGGPATAAAPLCAVISDVRNVPWFMVRKERKLHGTCSALEGSPISPALLVDDVLTTGASLHNAAHRCAEEGIDVIGFAVLLDREEGGREYLKHHFPMSPFYSLVTAKSLA